MSQVEKKKSILKSNGIKGKNVVWRGIEEEFEKHLLNAYNDSGTMPSPWIHKTHIQLIAKEAEVPMA